MRRSLILMAVLVFGVSSQAFAQGAKGARSKTKIKKVRMERQDSERLVKFIPLAGLTMHRYVGPGEDHGYAPGFNAGGLIDFGRGMTVLETGLIFSQLNSRYNFDGGGSFTVVRNNLTVPLQGKTYFSGRQDGFFTRYGILTNILLGAKTTTEYNGRSETEDAKDVFNTIDPMASLALGYEIDGGGASFLGDISFSRSLVDVTKDKESTGYGEAFMLNLGVRL